ncbi:nucleotide sugar dehydrogenase [Candidatus Dojkabacteria bacterium]|nr:nucleotide sugar dehydrogenase [Candidatus Dojkabacteria bacterium]
MRTAIIGSGYLGLTTGAVFSAAGHQTYCVDIKPTLIKTIKSGTPPFYEPYLDELVSQTVSNKKLIPTLSYEEAIPNTDISFVCVDTPGDKDGNLSIKSVKAAITSISKNIEKDNHIIVIKSTVPLGTANTIQTIIQENTDKKVHVARNPEFLAEGSAVFDTLLPDRIIIGTDSNYAFNQLCKLFKSIDNYAKKIINEENTRNKIMKFSKTYRSKFNYSIPFENRVLRTNTASSELIKMTANSYLAMKISYANAIANICENSDANVNEVLEGIGRDPRIGRDFLYAGLGWGGGCFPKDVRGLIKNAQNYGYKFNLLKEVENINNFQIDLAVNKVKNLFGKQLSKKTITILGLSYKPGTNDTRKSPAIKLVKYISKYVKKIKIYDPKSLENAEKQLENLDNIYFASNIEDVFKESNLAILATEWPEFLSLDFDHLKDLMEDNIIIDTRNSLDRHELESLGFTYTGIGI